MEPKDLLPGFRSYMSNVDPGGFKIFDFAANPTNNIQSMLTKESVAAKLIPESYTLDLGNRILKKLQTAKSRLEKNQIDFSSVDYLTIEACIEGISDGKSLSKELMTEINQIYKKYGS